MTRYLMIILVAVVVTMNTGCDSSVSALDEAPESVSQARLGLNVTPEALLPIVPPEEKDDDGCDSLTCDDGEEDPGDDCGALTCGGNDDRTGRDGRVARTEAPVAAQSLASGERLSAGFAKGEIRVLVPTGDVQGGSLVGGVVGFDVRQVFDARSQTGAGWISYRNDLGEWLVADVEHIQFGGDDTATFWGPVTASNAPSFAPLWVYVRVTDGGALVGGPDQFTYQTGPPNANPDGFLDEQGMTLTIIRGDIVVSPGSPASLAERR